MNQLILPDEITDPAERERLDSNRRVAFECLYEHLHMHDKHIYQILTIFGVLIGAVLYNLDKMRLAQPYTAWFVVVWGVMFILFTGRIAYLVTKIRGRIDEVALQLGIHPVLPLDYGRAFAWFRTAYLSIAIIAVGTAATILILAAPEQRAVTAPVAPAPTPAVSVAPATPTPVPQPAITTP
jgi:hypothetical protein